MGLVLSGPEYETAAAQNEAEALGGESLRDAASSPQFTSVRQALMVLFARAVASLLAYDTKGSVAAATALHKKANRPKLSISLMSSS
jgi:hypothetical protein